MRETIYNIIEPRSGVNKAANIYDIVMICIIVISFIPLFFKDDTRLMIIVDGGASIVFSIDYILRWITADFKFGKKAISSFLRYPFSMMAILDLLSILPGLIAINPAFRIFRIVRLARALQLVRIIRLMNYSNNLIMMKRVFSKQKQGLIMVFLLAVGYVMVSAIVLFNVEPDTFDNFFDALYWATISLTTIGYGDIYAVTDVGRLVTMISSFVGIAVVALPAGIITAGYVNEINRQNSNKQDQDNEEKDK